MLRMVRFIFPLAVVLIFSISSATAGFAKAGPVVADSPQTQSFDINAAVNTYLAKMPPALRARSDAYFEGGYWLILWDFLSTVLVMWLLLHFQWSARMRNLAERITSFGPARTALYWIQF